MLGCAACTDDPAFLSIATLCARYADDVCAARDLCCEASDNSAGCVASEQDHCLASSDAREQDDSFSYDSEQASRVLADQREQLDECGAPFSIGRFFVGTVSDGSACAQNAQCESDYCDLEQGACASNPSLLLCPSAQPEPETTPQPE